MTDIVIVLFNDFETLDVFGPVEVLGSFKEHFKLDYYSLEGGNITSSQNVSIATKKLDQVNLKGLYIVYTWWYGYSQVNI